jgi:hypothetical protein
MRAVYLALGIVSLAIAGGIAFGISAGLTPGSTGGAEDRPLIFWMIAPCYLLLNLLFWPLLLSWFVTGDLPRWCQQYIEGPTMADSLERRRKGRTIIDLARSLPPAERFGLARSVVGNGLFYVLLTVPMTVFFGVAGTVGNGLEVVEAVPLALALWIPLFWTGSLLVRAHR